MMKRITLLLLPLILFSCSIEYDGKTRFIVEGKVVDSDGNPMKDIDIEITRGESHGDLISYSTTDEDGYSLLMFPPPTNTRSTLAISIKPDDTFLEKRLINIEKADFTDFVFDFGTVTLFKLEETTTFQVELQKVNEGTRIENVTIDALTTEETVNFDESEEDLDHYETYFRILKNQNFVLYYTVTDFSASPATTTDYTVDLSVGTEPLTYTINY